MGRRTVRFPGLPDFNPQSGDQVRKVTALNWGETAVPNLVLVANGGAAGAIASGWSLPSEAYYDMVGNIKVPQAQQGAEWRALLSAIPVDRDVPMTVLGGGIDLDLQTWVRRYDKATPAFSSRLDFTIHLVAADPYKYGLTPVQSGVSMFVTETWFQNYTQPGARWVDTYSDTQWVNNYQQYVPLGAYNTTLTVTSAGTVPSRHFTVTLAGPLTRGQWFLTNLASGDKCWVNIDLGPNQRLTLDTFNRSALLDGSDVSELVFGDWLKLLPGLNSFRLIGGQTATAAYATVTALEAFE